MAQHFGSVPKAKKKLIGRYIVAINDRPCFHKDDAVDALCALYNANAVNFTITVANEPKLLAPELWRNLEELDLYTPRRLPSPDPTDEEDHTPDLSLEYIRHIAALHSSRFKTAQRLRQQDSTSTDDDSTSSFDSAASLDPSDPNSTFSPEYLPTDVMALAINAIRSSHTTTDEQSLGHFTRRKLKQLDTWPEWRKGEVDQLDKMERLGMYGKPCKRPPNAIVLRPH